MYEYLLKNGMTREEYHWFQENHVQGALRHGQRLLRDQRAPRAGGRSVAPSGEVFGYYVITHQYYDRYHLPVMHTETNTKDAAAPLVA